MAADTEAKTTAIWSRDASPQQIKADADWEATNWRRIEGCRAAEMPVPPHYYDAEVLRLRHKASLLRAMEGSIDDHGSEQTAPRDITMRPEYRASVMAAFDVQKRNDLRDFREKKAFVESAGRKRL